MTETQIKSTAKPPGQWFKEEEIPQETEWDGRPMASVPQSYSVILWGSQEKKAFMS